jgi:hypothetical protein
MRGDAVLAQGPRSDHELDPEALNAVRDPRRRLSLESAHLEEDDERVRFNTEPSSTSPIFGSETTISDADTGLRSSTEPK